MPAGSAWRRTRSRRGSGRARAAVRAGAGRVGRVQGDDEPGQLGVGLRLGGHVQVLGVFQRRPAAPEPRGRRPRAHPGRPRARPVGAAVAVGLRGERSGVDVVRRRRDRSRRARHIVCGSGHRERALGGLGVDRGGVAARRRRTVAAKASRRSRSRRARASSTWRTGRGPARHIVCGSGPRSTGRPGGRPPGSYVNSDCFLSAGGVERLPFPYRSSLQREERGPKRRRRARRTPILLVHVLPALLQRRAADARASRRHRRRRAFAAHRTHLRRSGPVCRRRELGPGSSLLATRWLMVHC